MRAPWVDPTIQYVTRYFSETTTTQVARPSRHYFQPIDVDDLRKLRGHSLATLMRARKMIPETPGIYIWRFWPTLADLEKDEFLRLWDRWRESQPQFEERVGNSRVEVRIRRTPFGAAGEGQDIFGFDFDNPKVARLRRAVESDADARQALAYTMECLLSAAPPLYVGKADNLQARLSNHFDGASSSLMQSLHHAGISNDDVYISYVSDPVSSAEESITTALEEIIQRITNPPLTKRYG